MTTDIGTGDGESPAPFAELPLFVWLSPAFPVGGFAYSHGLESAVEAGLVADSVTLGAWLDDLVAYGSIRQDALLLTAAWGATQAGDAGRLAETNALALALCVGRERFLETTAMGNAFIATIGATWPEAAPDALRTGNVAYPVAIGAASMIGGVALGPTLEAFTLAFVAMLVSAAIRLGVIGQTDGQRVTQRAVSAVRSLAVEARGATLDELGGCAFRSDLAALQHETQYSRLFRS